MSFVARLAVAALAAAATTAAGADLTLKIATGAPKGSVFYRVLQDMGEKWRAAEGPKARYIVYADSVQGSEAETVRRMRVGQLDASMITMTGLSEIDASVGVLQFIPLAFRSWEEVDYVREKLRPELEQRLRAKGFTVLFWGEGGWVHFFTKSPITTPEQFKSSRLFQWAGDHAQVDLMKKLGYRPVVLEVSDILPSLQTGMIDAVPAPPVWALVVQLDRPAPYMLRVNWAPIVGVVVASTKSLEAMSPAGRAALLAAGVEAGETLRAKRGSRDDETIKAMEQRGLKVINPTPEVDQAWDALARKAWPEVRGRLVPAETFDEVQRLLAEYRAARK
jgi:TRAP-type C4-dicarboxylate transport system substrate-binding protein